MSLRNAFDSMPRGILALLIITLVTACDDSDGNLLAPGMPVKVATVAGQMPQEKPAEKPAKEKEGDASRPADDAGRAREGNAAEVTPVLVHSDARQRVWFETLLGRPYIPGMSVALVPLPDFQGFFVLSRGGDLYRFGASLMSFELSAPDTDAAKNGVKYRGPGERIKIDDVAGRADLGSIGMALDPKYLENHRVYVWYADQKDENVALDRFTWEGTPDEITKSRTNIIRFSREHPPKPYHMGGIVQFLPDGTLIIGVGDAEREELAQNQLDLNGKILRIRPKDAGGYEVPADNPHVGDPAWRPEIMAKGVRAPFRGFLHQGKDLIFGDVGSGFEEINVWSGRPDDFGWGRALNFDGPEMPEGVTKPIFWWNQKEEYCAEDPDYAGETRMSVWAKAVYDGVPDRYKGILSKKLIFGDLMRGWVRAATLTPDLKVTSTEHIGHCQFLGDLVVAPDGYVYVVTFQRPGRLLRMRLAD